MLARLVSLASLATVIDVDYWANTRGAGVVIAHLEADGHRYPNDANTDI